MTATEERACAIIAKALKMQGGVTMTDDIATLAAWDSLAHMAIVLQLEAEIGRALRAEEIAAITSVASVAELIAGSR